MTKSACDQTPNFTETFDQVKRSSEIQSSECSPFQRLKFIFVSKAIKVTGTFHRTLLKAFITTLVLNGNYLI